MLDLRTAQPSTCPDHHVVDQRAKQHQQVLSLKALLLAFGKTQPLLVAFEAGFDASPTLIVRSVTEAAKSAVGSAACKRVRLSTASTCWADNEQISMRIQQSTVLSATARSNAASPGEQSRSGVQ